MDKPMERIKADAEAYANDRFGEYAGNINDFEYPAWKDCVDIYIAGATAENEHMRPVIEAAEKVAKIFAHKGDHQTCAICQLAKALEQWKGAGKEVEIIAEQARELLNPPEDNSPSGMPLPAPDPFTNPQK